MNELNPLKNEINQFKLKLKENEKEKIKLIEDHKLEISQRAKSLLQEKTVLKKVRYYLSFAMYCKYFGTIFVAIKV